MTKTDFELLNDLVELSDSIQKFAAALERIIQRESERIAGLSNGR